MTRSQPRPRLQPAHLSSTVQIPTFFGRPLRLAGRTARQSRREARGPRRDVLPTAQSPTPGKPEIGRRALISRIAPPRDRGVSPHHLQVPSGPRFFLAEFHFRLCVFLSFFRVLLHTTPLYREVGRRRPKNRAHSASFPRAMPLAACAFLTPRAQCVATPARTLTTTLAETTSASPWLRFDADMSQRAHVASLALSAVSLLSSAESPEPDRAARVDALMPVAIVAMTDLP